MNFAGASVSPSNDSDYPIRVEVWYSGDNVLRQPEVGDDFDQPRWLTQLKAPSMSFAIIDRHVRTFHESYFA